MTRADKDHQDNVDRKDFTTRRPDLSDIKGQNSIQYTVDVHEENN